jgi:folate-binding protein YgfZ
LPDELLLDFEPGLTSKISQRLEKYIVADDVQVVDVAQHYGLLTVQGPKSATVVEALQIFTELPAKPFQSVKISDATLGEIYLMNQPRLTGSAGAPSVGGFDFFVPIDSLGAVADKLIAAAKSVGGRACGWNAFEMARIEAGIPRFGADMDESNIPLECGIEARAVSYSKGCYIGQEVINRIHSIGHVNKELRGLRLADGLKQLPANGDKLFHDGKEAGRVTSAVRSAALEANLALGYVRREANAPETELVLRGVEETKAVIVELPFLK